MNNRKFVTILLIVLVVILGIYFYNQFYDFSLKKDNHNNTSIVSRVSELYLLPDSEPIIATVSDPSITFFKSSMKGDKVLLFPNNGKAVLYRPSINKIIDIVLIKNENQNKDEGISIFEDKTF